MPFFVICGKPDCENYAHAVYVAEYLKSNLPNFNYDIRPMSDPQWMDFLCAINIENNWLRYESPVIWKELGMNVGKKYLIGGLSEFWEYIYDYYNLESTISKNDLESLVKINNINFLRAKNVDNVESAQVVGIIGTSNYIIHDIIFGILNIKEMEKDGGIVIRLYDFIYDSDKNGVDIVDVADEINSYILHGVRDTVVIVESLKELIQGCDVLIMNEDYSKCSDQKRVIWFSKLVSAMAMLADVINEVAKPTLRIIFIIKGSGCFIANTLNEMCIKINNRNIVVVVSDEGFSYLNAISELYDVPVHKMAAPPIWGFVPLNMFVDVKQIITKCDVLQVYPRALTTKPGCTLPLGKIRSEIRYLSHVVDDENEIIKKVATNREKIEQLLKRSNLKGKLRGLMSLLKLWYSSNPYSSVISLGVCSNGTFGIPHGLVFAQPVVLDKHNEWIPFAQFPMNEYTKMKVEALVKETQHDLELFENMNDSSVSSTFSDIEADDFFYDGQRIKNGVDQTDYFESGGDSILNGEEPLNEDG